MEQDAYLPVETAADLIRALGGATALASKLGVTVQAVSNMKARGYFPSRYWLTLMHDASAMHVSGVSVEWLSALSGICPEHSNQSGTPA